LLISRYFGEATCGRYNLAYNLADIPATHVGEHIGEVLLPSLARLPADERAWGLVRATRLFAVIIFPLALGLSAVAETATVAIFDPRWKAMAPMLMILASLSIVRPLSWTIGSYLLSQQRPTTVAMMEAIKVCGLLGMMILLSRFGVLWACVAVGIAFGLDALLGMVAVRRKDGLPISELGGGVLPTLIACAPMYGAVFGTRYLLGLAGWGQNLLTLAIEIVAGVLVYIPSALLVSPTASSDLIQLGKKALLQRGDDDDDAQEDSGDDPDAPGTP
jgi:PST family polysaccharide transporter